MSFVEIGEIKDIQRDKLTAKSCIFDFYRHKEIQRKICSVIYLGGTLGGSAFRQLRGVGMKVECQVRLRGQGEQSRDRATVGIAVLQLCDPENMVSGEQAKEEG